MFAKCEMKILFGQSLFHILFINKTEICLIKKKAQNKNEREKDGTKNEIVFINFLLIKQKTVNIFTLNY